MQPPPGDALILKVGEGIAQREPGKFYAIFDGVPEYENDTLTVSKVFVHNGDVNLKSGNVRFDGPVEIKGSIEDGATVDVKGPLIVHGMIRAAFVRSEENIEVKEGIVTTERGRVICDNDVKADFTENSHIECSGSLLVNKAVLNSRVIAGKNIVVSANDGTLGGGNISCWSLLLAANIGFKNGAKTNLLLGVDAKALRKISIREKRLTKLREAGERYKNEFRELAQKKEAQMTAKHKQIKEKTKENLMRIKAVVEKAEMLLTNAKGSVKYNPDAIMGAQMTLSANCNIEIGGNPVQLETDFLATAVTAKRRRDGHACPIDDVKSEIERRVGSTTGETKKAG